MKAPLTSLRVLLVEDSEHDAELILRRLRRAGLQVTSKRVASEEALRAALAHASGYDAILMDYTVPGLDAPRTLELVRELGIDLPCIVVSGTVGEDVAVGTLHLGAADYLLKDRLNRLPSALQSAIERGRLAQARARAEREGRLLRDTALALGRGGGLGDALTEVLRCLGTAAGWPYGQAWLRRDDGVIACRAAWHEAGAGAEGLRGAELRADSDAPRVVDVLASGQPAHSANLEGEPRFARRAQAREAGFGAWAAFPVPDGSRMVAVLEFFAPRGAPGRAELSALVAAVAPQIGTAIARRHAAEERDRLFMLSHDLLGVMNPEGMLVQLNPAWERALGWRSSALRGTSWRDLVHPNDLVRAEREFALLREGGSVSGYECRLRRSDGAYRWIEWSASGSTEAGLIYAIGRDVTDSKESEERFRATFNQAAVGIIHTGFDSRFLRVNDRFCEIVGYTREELLELTFTDITHPEDVGTSWRELMRLEDEPGRSIYFEKRYLRKDGAAIWIALTTTVARGASGEAEYFITVVQDVGERRRMEEARREAEERYRSLVEQSPDAIYLVAEGKVVYCNGAGAALLGAASPDQIIGRLAVDFVHPDSRAAVLDSVDRIVISGEMVPPAHYPLLRLDGSTVEAEVTGAAMSFNGARVVQTVVRDITERRRYEARIEHLATHDALTGLPNRRLLADRLQQALSHARRSGQCLAIAMLDLDHFKFVNDSFGHSFGDRLLGAIAQRLRGALRDGDTLARIGGDEFIVLLTDLPRRDDVLPVLERLRSSLEAPFTLEGREVHTTVSIGLSVFPDDGARSEYFEALLSNADVAMYQAKARGRNTFQFYTSEMGARAVRRVEIEAALRRALERGELVLHLQPQFDLRSGRIAGAEALVRWNDPERGLVSPAEFIPVAEETGLIVPIGDWVLNEACRVAAGWAAAGFHGLRVSVNVSARQFRSGDFARSIREALHRSGLEAGALELELTESLIMDNAAMFISALRELRVIGVGLSIDDFGTGYSSLSYLKQFPVDRLKIDQSFVRDIPGDLDDAAIAQAVINLGHSLDLGVIAEGVETAAQLEFLRSRGCDQAQGYHLGRPQPAPDFLARLRAAARERDGAEG